MRNLQQLNFYFARVMQLPKSLCTVGRMVSLFVFINVLIYLDRGIIPLCFLVIILVLQGAPDPIKAFIRRDLGDGHVDTYFGILQMGTEEATRHGVHRSWQPPFKLMAFGLFVWCLAAVGSGLSPNYWVMLVARILSGVGEASFQCIVPPFIDDHAPAARRSLWLSIFYSAIPVGIAVGYGYGSGMAAVWTWQSAFFLEAAVMLPLVIIVWFLPQPKDYASAYPPRRPSAAEATDDADQPFLRGPGIEKDPAAARGGVRHGELEDMEMSEVEEHFPPQPTFKQELIAVFSSPTFVFAVIAYGAFSFTTAGIATFGPSIIEDLRLMDSETGASLAFGGIVSITGLIATPLGGILLDRMLKRSDRLQRHRLHLPSAKQEAAARLGQPMRNVASLSPGEHATPADSSPKESPDVPTAVNAGGMTEDEWNEDQSRRQRTLDLKLVNAFKEGFVFQALALAVLVFAPLASYSKVAFFLLLAIGCLFLFSTTVAYNIAVLASVPSENRSFAIGLSTMLMHAIGDVPSPAIIGALADSIAPEDAEHHRRQGGMRTTLLFTVAWLGWAVIFLGLGWIFSRRRRKRHEKLKTYVDVGGPDRDVRMRHCGEWVLDCGLVPLNGDPHEWLHRHCSCCPCGKVYREDRTHVAFAEPLL